MPISNQYRSPATVSKATIFLVASNASVILLSLGFDLLDLNLIHEIERGKQPSDAAIYASDSRHETIGRIAVLVFVFTAICFLRWVYVSASNAQAFSKRILNYSPGWAIGWYFIPFLNLVRPYQAMKEIWQVSHAEPGEAWRDRKVSSLVSFWWVLWIFGGIAGQISLRLALTVNNLSSWKTACVFSILHLSIAFVLNLVAISMVFKLSHAQELRSRLSDDDTTGRCPACGESLNSGSLICPMCGAEQTRETEFSSF